MKTKIISLKKTIVVWLVLLVMMITSTTAIATSYIGVSISKSGLKKSATSSSDSCVTVGAIISNKKGKVLASGENGIYSKNGYHTKSVSYTGLSSAYKAYGYAGRYDSKGTFKLYSQEKYY